jgi:hypothetical protein
MEAIEALTVAVGPAIVYQYIIQGLFHPARRVRDIFWKVFVFKLDLQYFVYQRSRCVSTMFPQS